MVRLTVVLLACATMMCFGQACVAADEGKAPEKTPALDKAKAEKPTAEKAQTAEEKEAAYAKTLEKRADDIMKELKLTDEAKAKAVREAVIAQYRYVGEWHETNDATAKELAKKNDDAAKAELVKLKAPLKAQHAKFVGTLEANLTAAQIETVKDYIVWRKLPVTYGAYCDELPNMTDVQKAKVLELLTQGREEAMDAGSAKDKTLVFEKYKGKVNIYLSSQGINMKEAEKEWKIRREARQKKVGDANSSAGKAPAKDASPSTEGKK
jgi:hypothetical protein